MLNYLHISNIFRTFALALKKSAVCTIVRIGKYGPASG